MQKEIIESLIKNAPYENEEMLYLEISPSAYYDRNIYCATCKYYKYPKECRLLKDEVYSYGFCKLYHEKEEEEREEETQTEFRNIEKEKKRLYFSIEKAEKKIKIQSLSLKIEEEREIDKEGYIELKEIKEGEYYGINEIEGVLYIEELKRGYIEPEIVCSLNKE